MTHQNADTNTESVNKARIFFGHQSVGQNILDAIQEMIDTGESAFSLVIDQELSKLPQAGFILHSRIGRNTDPLSKCRHFAQLVDEQLSHTVDIALFKFCYIDFDENTDIDTLFNEYRITMDRLKSTHPDITFLHVTVPLRDNPEGAGVWVREILGRPNRSKLANIKRNEFNQMLLRHYSDDPVFDLAKIESTLADGRRTQFGYRGKDGYHSLASQFTDDGGHLNQLGRSKAAEALIDCLGTVMSDKLALPGT